jgi:hypothetical protein
MMHHHHKCISISIILLSICNPVLTFLLMCQILNYILFQIDMEKLARFLPLHLIAVLMSSDTDEALFKYLLSGIRLLHSLCDLAPRHVKLEQVRFPPNFVLFCFCYERRGGGGGGGVEEQNRPPVQV